MRAAVVNNGRRPADDRRSERCRVRDRVDRV